MSAGGLLAQMFLGGAEKGAEGIGERLRREAKEAHDKAMQDDRQNHDAGMLATRIAADDEREATRTKNNRDNIDYEYGKQKGLLTESKAKDLWLDDDGNLTENGKGVPHFQRRSDNTLVPFKTDKGDSEKAKLYLEQLQEYRKMLAEKQISKEEFLSLSADLKHTFFPSDVKNGNPGAKAFDPEMIEKQIAQIPVGKEAEWLAQYANRPGADPDLIEEISKRLGPRLYSQGILSSQSQQRDAEKQAKLKTLFDERSKEAEQVRMANSQTHGNGKPNLYPENHWRNTESSDRFSQALMNRLEI